MADEIPRVAAKPSDHRLADLIARTSAPLVEGNGLFRELVSALPAPVYTTDAAGYVTYFNEAAAAIWGCRPELGKAKWCGSWKMFWPDGRELPHEQCPMAIAVKERRAIRGLEAVVERPDGSRVWLIPYPTPLYDDSGMFLGAVNMLVDISERKQVEERQNILMAELDHRVKNVLARVAMLAARTRKGTTSIDEYVRSFGGRIQSMAAAHNLLSESRWQNVGLGNLVGNQLAPYAGANVTMSGEDIALNPSQTQAVAMVLHELVTNAVKYGALSVPGGRVSITWDKVNLDAGARLVFDWCELGGPPVAAKVPFGYGTKLIRELIPHELGGTVDLAFATDGVNCKIEIPLE